MTPSKLLYFTASTGFKSGGLNNVPAAAASIVHYAPEFITEEEIGSKNRFFENRLQVNVAAFNYSYRNYQSYQFWRPIAALGAPLAIAGLTLQLPGGACPAPDPLVLSCRDGRAVLGPLQGDAELQLPLPP